MAIDSQNDSDRYVLRAHLVNSRMIQGNSRATDFQLLAQLIKPSILKQTNVPAQL